VRVSEEAYERAARYMVDPVAFIDDFVKVNELGKPLVLEDWQRALLRSAFARDRNGRLVHQTILWSQPKKSGKTAVNALGIIWYAFTQDAPNECLVVANDFEQARGRVFATVVAMIERNPLLRRSAHIKQGSVELSNGTVIRALACDYTGEAGANHGLVSFDELWGYRSERAQRLVEELTLPPTRPNPVRLITSYAGFHGESEVLWNYYLAGVGEDEHPDGRGRKLLDGWPVWSNEAQRLWCFWDHENRMPWQDEQYLRTQQITLRPSAFARLHMNSWTTAADVFLTEELWEGVVDRELSAVLPNDTIDLFLGVDASTKHDSAAVVAVCWDRLGLPGERLTLAGHRIWQPRPDAPLDIEATIEAYLRHLDKTYRVVLAYCDPYQLHRSIMTLQSEGLKVKEFPQTVANTTRMGQGLWDLVKGRNLAVYPDEDLRKQALSTIALDSGRGWRIAKDRASKKIDAIVALSMACLAAIDCRGQISASSPVVSVARGTPQQNRTRALFALATGARGRLSDQELGVAPWERE
jgi:phage terminase large subunit-like protein